jgi:hypothetical protein
MATAMATQGASFKIALHWYVRSVLSGAGTLTLEDDIVALRRSIQRLPDTSPGSQAIYIIQASAIASSLTPSGTRALFHQLRLFNDAGAPGRVLFLVDSTYDTATSLADLKTFFGILSELVLLYMPLKVIRVVIISSPSATTLARSMHAECVKQIVVESSLSTQVVVVKQDSLQELVNRLESFEAVAKASLLTSVAPAFGSMSPPAAMAPLDSCLKRTVSSSSQEQGSNKKVKANSSFKNDTPFHPSPVTCKSSRNDPQGESGASQRPRPKVQADKKVVAAKDDAAKDDDETNNTTLLALRNKTRNAVYSRRKYERKKIEIQVIKTEARRHKMQNAQLLQEQQRLEQLYAQAVAVVRSAAAEQETTKR